MADDLKEKQPKDATRVNIEERWEIEYWTKKLGVNEERLKAAVDAVGHNTDAVMIFLHSKK